GGKGAAEGVVGGDAVGQGQEAAKPVVLGVAELLDVGPGLGAADDGAQGEERMSPSRCFLVRSMRGSVRSARWWVNASVAGVKAVPPKDAAGLSPASGGCVTYLMHCNRRS